MYYSYCHAYAQAGRTMSHLQSRCPTSHTWHNNGTLLFVPTQGLSNTVRDCKAKFVWMSMSGCVCWRRLVFSHVYIGSETPPKSTKEEENICPKYRTSAYTWAALVGLLASVLGNWLTLGLEAVQCCSAGSRMIASPIDVSFWVLIGSSCVGMLTARPRSAPLSIFKHFLGFLFMFSVLHAYTRDHVHTERDYCTVL